MARLPSMIMTSPAPAKAKRAPRKQKMWNAHDQNGDIVNDEPVAAKNAGEAALEFLAQMKTTVREAD